MADYLPKNESELDLWFQNWGLKMAGSGQNFGFTATEIQQAQDDAAVAQAVFSGSAVIEAKRAEFNSYKRIIMYGEMGNPVPEYPQISLSPPPVGISIITGIILRTRGYVRHLKSSANYNEAVGADFRVLPIQSNGINPEDAKPILKVKSTPHSLVEVSFVKGSFDGIDLELQRDNSVEWIRIGRFIKSPALDDMPPLEPNAPEKRRYRARYLEGNDPIGMYSEIYPIVTTP